MVLLRTKITTTGVLYIPKEIREAFTRELKIIPNARAALFFPADAAYEDVLRSLEIIEADLRHRIELEKKQGCFCHRI
jgi:bifunctional DNA-binding transcriptional regulator/antitoxin component of YhaV-PrlF toxin-antitoxin module